MCLGVWSKLGYVEDEDVKSVTIQPEVDGEEQPLADNWDAIL